MSESPATHFLQDLAIILSLAALVTVLFQRLKLPVVAGYLVAGVAVGPKVAVGLIQDPASVRTLAEIGVVLLMMFVGLEFRLRRVARVGPRLGVAALIEVGLMLTLGFALAKGLGWGRLESALAAGIVAISSTAVIVKTFEEQGPDWRLRDVVTSLLILEDIIAIGLIAIVPTIAAGGPLAAGDVGWLFGKLLALLLAMSVVGMLVVPPVLRAVVALGRPETILVSAVGITFLFALLTHQAGYSVALGAFLAGVLMSESGVSHQVGEIVRPVRDLFAAVFFVAVGMLLDVPAAIAAWPLVLAFVAVVVGGKILGVSVGAFLTGFGTRISIQAGLSMAQIGEFSFIIAGLGVVAIGGPPLYSIAVATAIVTAFLTPWLVSRSEAAALWVDRRLPHPLQTFSSLYGSWLETLGQSRGAASPWRRSRRLVRLLVLDSVVLAVLLVGTSVAYRESTGWLARFGIATAVERLVILGAGAALAIPFGFGLVLAGRRLARQLAESVVPPVAAGKVDQGRAPRRLLQISVEVAITLAIGIPLVVATLPFLPPFGAPGVIVALLALLGLSFWRTARDLDSHARAGAELVVHVLARQAARGRGDGMEAVRGMLPGLGDLEPIRIEPGSPGEGKTLGDLNLRGRTGATVVGLVRGEDREAAPDADTRLSAGDWIAVTGTHQAITEARDLVRARDTSSRSTDTAATAPPAEPPSGGSGGA